MLIYVIHIQDRTEYTINKMDVSEIFTKAHTNSHKVTVETINLPIRPLIYTDLYAILDEILPGHTIAEPSSEVAEGDPLDPLVINTGLLIGFGIEYLQHITSADDEC
jgi:hypothetical protein